MISIGIDIGSYSIKVAEIAATAKDTYKLNRQDVYPLSTDPNKDNEIEILDTLRTIASGYNSDTTRFVLSVDQRFTSLRRRLFPFKERHKILKSLPFELEEEIPLSQFDAIFDAKVTRYVLNQADIIAVVCPKDHIEKMIQLTQDCQINMETLSVNSLAISNLFENWQEVPPTMDIPEEDDELIAQPAEVLINFGYTTTDVLVFKDNYLLEVRTFSFGGQDLANAISAKYGIQNFEAIKELESKSFVLLDSDGATADQITFSDTIKEAFNSFTQQLNLTLIEVKSVYNLNFVKASTTGGISQIKDLTALLTQKTEIPFQRFHPFNTDKFLISSSIDPNHAFIASTSIGLAIEGLKKPKNPAINLLKGDFAQQSHRLQQFFEKWSHTLIILAVTFALSIVYGVMRENLTLSMSDTAYTLMKDHAKKIAGLKGRKASARNIKKHIKKQKKILKDQKITADLQKINSAMDIMKMISGSLPSSSLAKLNIKKLIIDNSTVIIEGETEKRDMLGQISNSLSRVSSKGKVTPSSPSFRAQKGWVPFGYRFTVPRLTEDI